MLRVTAEAEATKTANSGVNNVATESSIAARKF
jgi:hypothetical protein